MSRVAIITGSGGLIGSEAARQFSKAGLDIVGIDNDMRATFFGPSASTKWNLERLQEYLGSAYRHLAIDIRDDNAISHLFEEYGDAIDIVVHTAAQPSHDWAARDPQVDFTVNANGTLNLLEATRRFAPGASFIFTSTNKVYGDTPNRLPLRQLPTRWEIEEGHPYEVGIPESMSIDSTMHSLFGASKVAADVLVQEYGRYFGMNTVCFRGGCLTGPGHSGTELHGFLAYLMECVATGREYTVFGYEGKQVRDNIHSSDLVEAMLAFYGAPRSGEVYNIGGGRASNCSMLEAIALCEGIVGRMLDWKYSPDARAGDHIWYVSDLAKFRGHYPQWDIRFGVEAILQEMFAANEARWRSR